MGTEETEAEILGYELHAYYVQPKESNLYEVVGRYPEAQRIGLEDVDSRKGSRQSLRTIEWCDKNLEFFRSPAVVDLGENRDPGDIAVPAEWGPVG